MVINLSAKIDEFKEHNEDVIETVNNVNSDGGFTDYSFYSIVIDMANDNP